MLAVEFMDDAVEGSLVNEWLVWVDKDKIDAVNLECQAFKV